MEVLEKIGYISQNGLVMCNRVNDADNNSEKLLLSEARELGATAVLFRRHYDKELNRSIKSDPSVYIFQISSSGIDKEAHESLHAKIWSAGQCEVYIILSQTSVEIFNGRQPAGVNGQSLDLSKLKLVSEAIEKFSDLRFSASIFSKGVFWEQEDFEPKWSEKDNPYVHLLDHLKVSRKLILENSCNKISNKSIDRLLILSLLVKFIEGIREANGKHSLTEIYNRNNVENLENAVENGKLLEILSELSNVFNGKIFELDDDVKAEVKNGDLSILSQFLSGNINSETKQLFLWQQYDFKYLPAEVISAIYEYFIQADSQRESEKNEKSVVYTPIHLVNLLVDDVMPLENASCFKNESFKLLDPTCGSGVFLVAAYKRLLQWWAINNSINNEIVFPDAQKAQSIMESNIFGVDILPTATYVSIFGLTIALLEKLTPKEIWNNLRFNDLNSNIKCESFISWATTSPKDFDLVIGNPPFNVPNDQIKKDILKPELLNEIGIKHKIIPASNFALHFFEIAMTLTKKVCMILPSAVLLYSKSSINHKYRRAFFSDYSVQKIYDFTHLRRVLFHGSAEVSVLALIATNNAIDRKPIEHIAVRRIVEAEKIIRFEIDHYDRHFVPWSWAVDETKSFIWKCNLLGGGRLFHLIYRLSLLPKLINYIDSNDLEHKRGYEGGNGFVKHNVSRIIEVSSKAQITLEKNVSIYSNKFKNESIYSPPFLIFDQVINDKNLSFGFVKEEDFNGKQLYFNRDFFSISYKRKKGSEINNIFTNLSVSNNSNLFNYSLFLYCISSSCLVMTESDVNKSEILSLPFSDVQNFLELSNSEIIIQNDVLDFYIHFGKAISKNSAGEKFYLKTTSLVLELYGKAFCDLINPLHGEDNMVWQVGDVYTLENERFIAFQFIYGKQKSEEKIILKAIDSKDFYEEVGLIINNKSDNRGAIFNRIVKWYGSNDEYDYVIFIKPNAKRYWLQSIALRDADEVSWDYYEEGY